MSISLIITLLFMVVKIGSHIMATETFWTAVAAISATYFAYMLWRSQEKLTRIDERLLQIEESRSEQDARVRTIQRNNFMGELLLQFVNIEPFLNDLNQPLCDIQIDTHKLDLLDDTDLAFHIQVVLQEVKNIEDLRKNKSSNLEEQVLQGMLIKDINKDLCEIDGILRDRFKQQL